MFIVLEGIDGSGKSTTANAIADALQGVALTTPLDKFKSVRPELESIYGNEFLARQLFYASTAIASSNRVGSELLKSSCVVIDRYWLSTQVYHSWYTKGAHMLLPEVENILLKPDLTVFLNISLEDRLKRLSKRSVVTAEDSLTATVKADEELSGLYRSFSNSKLVGKWLEVDASQSTEQIVQEVLQSINS